MDVAKDILAFAVLFVVSAGLVFVGLEIWCRNAKRWRLIRNAYIEGVRDANKVNTAKENSND
jgi:hypothetical protein